MTWHYNCPNCGQPLAVDWMRHREEVVCRKCRTRHYPPTPDEDHYAYISGLKWPPEMEQVVVARRGTTCVVPGCFSAYQTLCLRRPISLGGRICVDNLVPVCFQHAREKGERDFDEWVAELKNTATSVPVLPPEVNTEPVAPPRAEPEPVPVVSYVQSLARGCDLRLSPRPGNRPVVKVPFLRGPVRRLVFEYEWEVRGGTESEVMLVAWPRGVEPKLEELGSENFTAPVAKKWLQVERDARGEGCVILELPAAPAGRWTAAVVINGTGNIAITEYVLAGTD